MEKRVTPRIPVFNWSNEELCKEIVYYIENGWPVEREPYLVSLQVVEEFYERGLKLEDGCDAKTF